MFSFLGCNNGIVVTQENTPFLRTYMLNYLGVKYYDSCNLLSNCLAKLKQYICVCMCVCEKERDKTETGERESKKAKY